MIIRWKRETQQNLWLPAFRLLSTILPWVRKQLLSSKSQSISKPLQRRWTSMGFSPARLFINWCEVWIVGWRCRPNPQGSPTCPDVEQLSSSLSSDKAVMPCHKPLLLQPKNVSFGYDWLSVPAVLTVEYTCVHSRCGLLLGAL